jgi:hypothetical protein
MVWANVVNALLGIWFIVAPFALAILCAWLVFGVLPQEAQA